MRTLGAALTRSFDRFSDGYGRFAQRTIRASAMVWVIYVGLLALAAWRVIDTPRGFIPAQDQGDVSISMQLPVGATLARPDALTQQALDIILEPPGVGSTSTYAGVEGNGFNNQSSSTQLWAVFEPFEQRLLRGQTALTLAADLRRRLSVITGADFRISQPSPVIGLGSAGGFRMMIEDKGGQGYPALEAVRQCVTWPTRRKKTRQLPTPMSTSTAAARA